MCFTDIIHPFRFKLFNLTKLKILSLFFQFVFSKPNSVIQFFYSFNSVTENRITLIYNLNIKKSYKTTTLFVKLFVIFFISFLSWFSNKFYVYIYVLYCLTWMFSCLMLFVLNWNFGMVFLIFSNIIDKKKKSKRIYFNISMNIENLIHDKNGVQEIKNYKIIFCIKNYWDFIKKLSSI